VFGEEFGRHLVGCALFVLHECCHSVLRVQVADLDGLAEVSQLEVAVFVEDDVGRLEVAEDDAVLVQLDQRADHVHRELAQRDLRQDLVLDHQRQQVAPRTVLLDHPDVVAGLIPGLELQDVFMLQFVEYFYFV